MKNIQTLIITSVLTLLIGLLGGYLLGVTNNTNAFHGHDGMMQHSNNEASQFHGSGMGMGSMMLGSGADTKTYEQRWLAQMIVHHQGAVVSSEALLNRTERPELREFAENIINTQSREIDTMQGWLDTWYENE
jgi:uncharacterized protein (DUF305 family)